MNIKRTIIAVILTAATAALSGCGGYKERTVKSEELTANLSVSVQGKAIDDDFIKAYYNFTAELFKRTNGKDNSFISPMSAAACLSMAFNGASGETLAEFERVMGLDIDELNGCFRTVLNGDDSVKYANSVWLNANKKSPKTEFLNAAKGYYDAEVYRAIFDSALVKDINNWVANKTRGMIDEIIDDTSPEFYAYLLNALYFEAEWAEKYENSDIQDWEFHNKNGEKKSVSMLCSTESEYFSYLGGDGFLKRYDGDYAFAAILPDKDTDIDEFINKFDGESFALAIKNRKFATVNAKIPEFKSDYEVELTDALKDMGIVSAFSPTAADFSKMCDDVYIDFVLQKTKIELDRRGTKAAAVTIIGMKDACVAPDNTVDIVLDRPFVYAIISMKDGLPLFIGSMKNIK